MTALNVTLRMTGVNSSLALKAPVRCATTGPITLSGVGQTIDGVTYQASDLLFPNLPGVNKRVLVKNQTDPTTNGIYDVNTAAWTRSADWDGSDDFIQGTRVFVAQGTTQQGTTWYLSTADPVTLNTSAMNFTAVPIANLAFADGTVGNPSIDFAADTTTGFYRVGTGQIGVATSGVQSFLFAAVGGHGTATAPALSVTGVTVDVRVFGAVCDGVTDDSTAVQNAINSLSSTGGIVRFPYGTTRINSQITFPNDGGSPTAKQPSIRLTGAGASPTGRGEAPNGGTILDLRYSGSDAKILTIGSGSLEIDHLTLIENGSSGTTTPFILTVNTTVNIHHVEFYGFSSLSGTNCVQDCVIFGGTGGSAGNTTSSIFQGYGSVMWQCYGNRIRRLAYLRSAANNVVVRDNTIWGSSGSNLAGGAAIEIDGTGSNADGNIICGNLIEQTGYPYGIKVTAGVKTQISDNGLWDETGGTSLAYYRFESGTLYNFVRHGHGKTSGITIVSDANSAPSTNAVLGVQLNQTSYWPQPWTFATNVMVGPNTTPQSIFGVSNNTAANLPTVQTGTTQLLASADGVNNNLEMQVFGSSVLNGFNCKAAGGTGASPSATPSSDFFFNFSGFGFDGSAWQNRVQMIMGAAESWGASANGTNFKIQTTAVGTTARTNTFQIDGHFNVAIGATAAVATNATNGWPYLVTSAGAPTGTPATTLGAMVPFQGDTTNNSLWAYQSSNWRQYLPSSQVQMLGGSASGVNFNSATTDNQITINLPAGITRYFVNAVIISNASHTLTTATCGVFTAAGGTGGVVVTTGAISVSATTEATANNAQALTVNPISSNTTSLYFRVVNAEGAAATADVDIYITPLH